MVAAIAAGIGAVGSIAGGMISKSGSSKAAQQALTGYNYLTGSKGVQGYVDNGNDSNNMEAQLLGAAPLGEGTSNAFNKYLDSTGYNFQMDQGTRAITGSAASKGLLNSGATAKALTTFGQGLGASYFNNYLTQLHDVSNSGLTASGQIGAAGTGGGSSAAGVTASGSNSLASGISGAAGIAANYFGNSGSPQSSAGIAPVTVTPSVYGTF